MKRATFANRATLGAAVAALGLLITGCGSSSSNEGLVTRPLQDLLVHNAETQLAPALNAKEFRIVSIACEPGTSDVASCQLNASEARGQNGTIAMSVSIVGGVAQVQITGISNPAWAATMQRAAKTFSSTTPLAPTRGG